MIYHVDDKTNKQEISVLMQDFFVCLFVCFVNCLFSVFFLGPCEQHVYDLSC